MTGGGRSLRPSPQAAIHPTPRSHKQAERLLSSAGAHRLDQRVADAVVAVTAGVVASTMQSHPGGGAADPRSGGRPRVKVVESGAAPPRVPVWGSNTGQRRP